jgi:hypothetical protein
VGSDYLFGDCSQRAVSRFGCGKSSVIKQTLEMQSENASAARDSLKETCLARGFWVAARGLGTTATWSESNVS